MPLPALVEEVVRRVFGEHTEVVATELPGDWQVARLRLAGTGGPRSVIAKWLRSNAQGWRTDPVQMAVEVVGLRFAEESAPGLVPQVIGTMWDADTGGVMLLEDLAPRRPLDAIICAHGVSATTAVRLDYARAIGRLAASTAGREAEFLTRLDGAAPMQDARLRLLGPPWPRLRQLLDGFGVEIATGAEQEMGRLRRLFAEPGPFLALSNGDMMANNFMIDIDDPDDHGRLIDFEFAHFDHALAHAANFFVPGPRWMVVDDPIADQLEKEFRTTVTAGIPQAADDDSYQTGIAAGCVAMGFERCGNLPVMDSRPPGHQSRLQRIATIEAAATSAEARGRWPALTGLLRDLARTLRRRWPDADVDTSSLAPYTPRTD